MHAAQMDMNPNKYKRAGMQQFSYSAFRYSALSSSAFSIQQLFPLPFLSQPPSDGKDFAVYYSEGTGVPRFPSPLISPLLAKDAL
jgi:hypothetical protein